MEHLGDFGDAEQGAEPDGFAGGGLNRAFSFPVNRVEVLRLPV